MLYLDESTIEDLNASKNLLAFSAGVDSSALFFLLLENNIKFDIALINYQTREQSHQEEAYAKELSKRYHLTYHITHAPNFKNNFEKNARDFRYDFFDTLMQKHEYTNLLTAHQLEDQLEWLLMRLSKGAGLTELLGLESISIRKEYTLIRPILHHSKAELLSYLHQHQHHYFIDESNQDEKYERNWFRKNISEKLILKYHAGIQKSFEYLKEDEQQLMIEAKELFHEKELYILEIQKYKNTVRIVDKYLKKLGYLLSSGQRKQLNKNHSMVIGGLWAVEFFEHKVFIAPFKKEKMPKIFKEACRKLQIPSKIRPYIYHEKIDIKEVEASF
jgi:tRNA(Ile)-lysidine synthase